MAPRGYSPEFRQRVVDPVEAGRPVAQVATEHPELVSAADETAGVTGASTQPWRGHVQSGNI